MSVGSPHPLSRPSEYFSCFRGTPGSSDHRLRNLALAAGVVACGAFVAYRWWPRPTLQPPDSLSSMEAWDKMSLGGVSRCSSQASLLSSGDDKEEEQ